MAPPRPDLVVSACLLGHACRYDGASKGKAGVRALVDAVESSGGRVVAVCPEELGGLSTPRPAADLRGGDGASVLDGRAQVRTEQGDIDVTAAFVDGAQRAFDLAAGATRAVCKARSPSCGCGTTQIEGQLAKGDGVFAALLRRHGVDVRTDEDELAPLWPQGARR